MATEQSSYLQQRLDMIDLRLVYIEQQIYLVLAKLDGQDQAAVAKLTAELQQSRASLQQAIANATKTH